MIKEVVDELEQTYSNLHRNKPRILTDDSSQDKIVESVTLSDQEFRPRSSYTHKPSYSMLSNQTPQHLSTSRFTHFSPNLLVSSKPDSLVSFTDEESPYRPNVQIQLNSLMEHLTVYTSEATTALSKVAEMTMRLNEEKALILHRAQRILEEENRERNIQIDRHRHMLQVVVEDMKTQELSLVKAMNSSGVTESFLQVAKGKFERSLNMLKQELGNVPNVSLDFELQQRAVGKELKEKCTKLGNEIETLRNVNLELNQKLSSIGNVRNSEEIVDNSKLQALESRISALNLNLKLVQEERDKLLKEKEEISQPLNSEDSLDKQLSIKIEDIIQLLLDYSNTKVQSDTWRSLKKSFKPSQALIGSRASEGLDKLEDLILSTLKQVDMKLKFKNEISEKALNSLRQSSLSEIQNLQKQSESQIELIRSQVREEEILKLQKELEKLRFENLYCNETITRQKSEILDQKKHIDSLKNEISDLKTHNFSFREDQEQAVQLALADQEIEFEKRLQGLQRETREQLVKAHEKIRAEVESRYDNENALQKMKIATLEEEKKTLENQLESLRKRREDFEEARENFTLDMTNELNRKLEQVRRVHTEKYEELFRITTAQIKELEQKLALAENQKTILAENAKQQLKREMEAERLKEIHRIQNLHRKELNAVTNEFEDFVAKSQLEIARIARMVEEIQNSGYSGILKGVQEDLSSLARRLNQQKRSKLRPEFEIEELNTSDADIQCNILQGSSLDQRVCKRCGKNDNQEKYCKFHPYLVKWGAADFLYGPEWHRCREEGHSKENEPCFSYAKHYYGMSMPENGKSLRASDDCGSELKPEMLGVSSGKLIESRRERGPFKNEKERIRATIKDLKESSSRSVSPSVSHSQQTGTFKNYSHLPFQPHSRKETIDHSRLDDELFFTEKKEAHFTSFNPNATFSLTAEKTPASITCSATDMLDKYLDSINTSEKSKARINNKT